MNNSIAACNNVGDFRAIQNLTKMSKKNIFRPIDLLLLLHVIFCGFNYPIVKAVLSEFLPMSFNIIRFITASTLLLILRLLIVKNQRIEKADWKKIILLALIGHTGYQLFFIYGIKNTTASNAALIIASIPLLTAAISSITGYEKVRTIAWIGILFSFVGIFLIIKADPQGFNLNSNLFKGNILIILSAISWASYTVLAKPLLRKYSPLKITSIAMSIGTLFLIPFSINEIKVQSWRAISTLSWIGLFYSAVFAIAYGYTIWYRGVKKIGTTRTAIYSNLIPILAALFAWLLLSEILTLYHLIGAGIIFAGIYLTHFSKGR